MQDNEQVFLYMKEEIERLANKEEAELISAMKKAKNEIYEQLVMEAKKEASIEYDVKLKEIKKETSSDNVEKSAEYTKTLVQKREAYVSTIMEEVKQKVIQFIHSDNYLEYLLKSLKEAKGTREFVQPVLYVSLEDMKYQKELVAAFGSDIAVEQHSKDILGGFILVDSSRGLYVDHSFDFILENQKTWFYDNSGFTLK